LDARAVDAERPIEERNLPTAEVESFAESGIRQLRAVLGLENIEGGEARAAHIIIAHAAMIADPLAGRLPNYVGARPLAAAPEERN
jgi:hypothetical protein